MNPKKWLTVLIMTLTLTLDVFATNAELKYSYYLDNVGKNENLIQAVADFIITKDGKLLIVDSKASNIKIFSKEKLIKVFGRKGLGPSEFIAPSSVAYKDPYLMIHDFRRDSFFLYKIGSELKLKPISKSVITSLVDEMHFIENGGVVCTGQRNNPKDQHVYSVFSFDWNQAQYKYILSGIFAYGCNSESDYTKLFVDKVRFLSIGGSLAIGNDSIYFCNANELRCIRVNQNHKIVNSFGEYTKNFSKPEVTPEMKRAFRTMNFVKLHDLKRKYSFVLKVLVSRKQNLIILYSRYSVKRDAQDIMAQVYSPDGVFLQEYILMESKAHLPSDLSFFYNKTEAHLFALVEELNEDGEEVKYGLYCFEIR